MCTQKEFRRIMMGRRSANVDDALSQGFAAAGFLPDIDMTEHLNDEWRDFNRAMIPRWLENNPGKSKVAAGLACGMLHTICKGAKIGDIVLTPDLEGNYYFGEISGDYFYDPNYELPHKRPVKWYDVTAQRNEMSDALRNSVGSGGTVSNVTKHAKEIELLISDETSTVLIVRDETIEDPVAFALERHLEDFLVANWSQTLLGQSHDIYFEDGENIGQQYQTDAGIIDILAISKDGKELLVVELKKGRASDNVVGQVLRYMGYVASELAENDQSVRGVIVALNQDKRIEYALKVSPNIDFYQYMVKFELLKT